MQSKDLYARLELLTPEQVQSQSIAPTESRSCLGSIQYQLGLWGKALLRYFTGSQQPQITVRRDRDGLPLYEVYDPYDRQHHVFGTEQEVRVWLEQRYYQ